MKIKLTVFLLLVLTYNAYSQTNFDLDKVLHQLNLKRSQCEVGFIVSKQLPSAKNETIVVIPEIIKSDDTIEEYNGYILIIDSDTNKIKHKYFKPSYWTSDALILSEIKIDTAPYYVSKNKRAFGIRSSHYTLSKPNPYSSETLTLFLKKEEKLIPVLDHFESKEYVGEWDMQCVGWSINEEKILILSKNKTDGFFDIIVNNKITNRKSDTDETGECIDEEKISFQKTVLKFNGKVYK
ncbi:hypothetical protein [uncultured Tenacibaculum sp.]|uniref:hypothetical protein n=1 Tax=uncultured Tenacibaculum sp. TaxID=174713 RepID=UPI0026199F0D|nr:hypothetical protein [uncultured Tenacibaculum sp.]